MGFSRVEVYLPVSSRKKRKFIKKRKGKHEEGDKSSYERKATQRKEREINYNWRATQSHLTSERDDPLKQP